MQLRWVTYCCMHACHLNHFRTSELVHAVPAAEQNAGAPVQYMRMRRPARSGAAASIQARRSLKQRMPGSSVCTPSCGRTDHALSHYLDTFF